MYSDPYTHMDSARTRKDSTDHSYIDIFICICSFGSDVFMFIYTYSFGSDTEGLNRCLKAKYGYSLKDLPKISTLKSVLKHTKSNSPQFVCFSVLQCVVVCCSVLQCVAVCCSVLQFVKCSALKHIN